LPIIIRVTGSIGAFLIEKLRLGKRSITSDRFLYFRFFIKNGGA